MSPEPGATLLRVVAALDRLGLTYCVGGSFASSFYSLPRSTNDIDLVVALRPEHIAPLIAALKHNYMIDPQAVSTAIERKRSFNIIDLTTFDKVDLFVATGEPWSQQQLQRRRPETLSVESNSSTVFFASPEDVILSKLVWYRLGGEVSDRQWQDLLNVFLLQSDNLDRAYLQHWAADLGVSDLLTRAATEAEQGKVNI